MTVRVRLADIAQARSGDKGDVANVALFAPTDALYDAFRREVTTDRVRALFGRFVKGDVDRYEVPNVRALNFVLHQALDGGAARSLRSDPLGKSYGSLLLRMEIEVEDDELTRFSRRTREISSLSGGLRGCPSEGGVPPRVRSAPALRGDAARSPRR